jgi:hypothetical protein
LVHKAQPELKVHKVLLELKALLAPRAQLHRLLAHKVLKVQLVRKVLLELKVLKAPVLKVQPELKVLKVQLVRKVLLELKVLQPQQVDRTHIYNLMILLVRMDLQDLRSTRQVIT